MNRIKDVRETHGMSQKTLAETVGISRPFLCDLEKNRRGAKPDTMHRIADALGVAVTDLEQGAS